MGWAAWALIAISLVGLAINLYFTSLLYRLPAWLTRLLGGTAAACGIDGGSCKRVVQTPYARLFGGQPNVLVGLAWCVLVIVLSAIYLQTGTFYLWWPCMAIAVASLLIAVYLVYVLLFVLHDPCPL